MNLGWYNLNTFDNKEYEYYEQVQNGDMNTIIPNKFIAFMGPIDAKNRKGGHGNAPEDYLQVFHHFKVSRVVRLNEP
jgi:cell division cycle 14